ncbi:hypothetical protein CRG98_011305 [Punica granatum]|uniref:Uncharacterized protein n=1 Tax=Punica granatum TaxID=22663 RepID=A0A2I0KJ16_PUNGR|nr:hypothetical protein CRG98_011305 [Punica granatum]
MGRWLLDWADGGRTGLLLNRAGPLDDWAAGPAYGLLLDWVFPGGSTVRRRRQGISVSKPRGFQKSRGREGFEPRDAGFRARGVREGVRSVGERDESRESGASRECRKKRTVQVRAVYACKGSICRLGSRLCGAGKKKKKKKKKKKEKKKRKKKEKKKKSKQVVEGWTSSVLLEGGHSQAMRSTRTHASPNKTKFGSS